MPFRRVNIFLILPSVRKQQGKFPRGRILMPLLNGQNHFWPTTSRKFHTWVWLTQGPIKLQEGYSAAATGCRSEEHTSELQSQSNLVCRLLLEKKKKTYETLYESTNITNTLKFT